MTNKAEQFAVVEPELLWDVPARVVDLIADVEERIFRRDTSQPGFALIDLGAQMSPARFRSILIGFFYALDGAYLRQFSRRLLLRSVGRFDQNVSTEAHLDGAPAESILMLGYEPSEIQSRLEIIDYTRCAVDMNLTPVQFLERVHFSSESGRKMLQGYAMDVQPFDSRHYRIAIINNSRMGVSAAASGMLGVLHKSTVAPAQPGQDRFINTLLMSPAERWADDLISAEALRTYSTSGVFATT